MNTLTLKSYAKLNLFLQVLHKRKDNFHNIKTLFERISLSDEITLNSLDSKEIKVYCRHPQVPKDSSNLCYRSALALQQEFDLKKGARISLQKNIPVGAGLGGGSSNAATVLLGLNRLWGLKLTKNKLAKVAERIGSDVPFFIYEAPFAMGEEKGNKIEPLPGLKKNRFWHILVVPKIHVSTPLIYAKWDEFRGQKDEKAGLTRPAYDVKLLTLALRRNGLSSFPKLLFNGLEAVTFALYPEVRLIKEKMARLGVKAVLMSGSGPAVFAIVSSRKEAASISRKLKKEGRPWNVFVSRTV